MKEEIRKEWQTILKSFRADVESSLLKTKVIVEQGWDNAVQCEIDNQCCEYNAVNWTNLQTQIKQTQRLITTKQTQLQQVNLEIEKMRTMCEDEVAFDTIVIPETEDIEIITQEDNDGVQS